LISALSDTSGIAFGVCFLILIDAELFGFFLFRAGTADLSCVIYDSTLPDERECGVFFTSCFNSV
jgi:hypothetical protein